MPWPLRTQTFSHYNDVIMSPMASEITSLTIVYSTVYSGTDQRKHQSSASLAFAWGIHRWPVNSPHKGPVTRKMFSFFDVIMIFISSIMHNESVALFLFLPCIWKVMHNLREHQPVARWHTPISKTGSFGGSFSLSQSITLHVWSPWIICGVLEDFPCLHPQSISDIG